MKKNILIFLASIFLLFIVCVAVFIGWFYFHPIEVVETNFSQEEKIACEAKGGRYMQWTFGFNYSCRMPTDDADKLCMTFKDCESECIGASNTPEPKPGRCSGWGIR